VLITQAKQLRRELEYWSNLVSGHHAVRLIDISIRLHNKLSVIESDLDWDQEVLDSLALRLALNHLPPHRYKPKGFEFSASLNAIGCRLSLDIAK
jgi:hypothetical protein